MVDELVGKKAELMVADLVFSKAGSWAEVLETSSADLLDFATVG